MAITTTTTLSVLKEYEFISPLADADPLKTILENTNYLYRFHRPSWTYVYTVDPLGTGQTVFQIPIPPSADGLTYQFVHYIRTGTGTGTLSVDVEEYDSGWNSLESSSGIAAAATSPITHSHTDTISATSTILRITYDRAGGPDTYTPDSLVIYPAPPAPTTSPGVYDSGFVTFDDGLLAATGAPITTEHVNRAAKNALRVLEDRWFLVSSFVQEDSSVNAPRNDAADLAQTDGEWGVLGRAVFTCPHQKDPTVRVYVFATVDVTDGAGDLLVRLGQVGGKSTVLAADGAINSGTLQLSTDGTASASADLVLEAQISAGGRSTYVHAVCTYWQPGS